MADDEYPRVEGGLLTKPYPIKTRGDLNRARVLPPPRPEAKAPVVTTPAPSTSVQGKTLEQPRSGFDYVQKRNQLIKPISTRSSRRRLSRA